uniref:J domain-containing protein n=1 Tax=viral metagenome TaxID=1070528 RepID=A0A6C0AZ70_9ZZZZ
MNYSKAINILKLSYNFNEKELKHQYYLKALLYHPDKNQDLDAKTKFQEILEAYNFLNKYKNFLNESEESEENENSYSNILDKFINCMLNKNIDINNFLYILNNKCSKLSIDLFQHFSKNTLLKLHEFIRLYSDNLHINKSIIKKLDELIKEYTKNDIIEIIRPSLENLINDEIYKYSINNEIYYIPMWHNELVYEISNNLLIIQCEPELPEYINIDEYNNLYVNISTTIKSILNENSITINIGEKKYTIPLNELYIRKYQRYTFLKQGISLIDTKEIYNVDSRANVYVDIFFTDVSESAII